MKYALCCLFKATKGEGAETVPHQVGETGVRILDVEGLRAVVSKADFFPRSPDTAMALNHHRIIEAFWRMYTVIPFRYGAVFDTEAEILRLIEKRAQEYHDMIISLGDSAEMGVRLILSRPPTAPAVTADSRPADEHKDTVNPGTSYLLRLREMLAKEDAGAKRNETVIEAFCAEMDGLYVKFRSEASRAAGAGPLILSLYFLVPKGLVSDFRKAFARVRPPRDAKVLLTGPWPPYNFVGPEARTNEAP